MKPPSGLVPEGEYRAELVGVDPFENSHGARIGFRYRLLSCNVEVMHSANVSRSLSSKLADIARSIAGRELEPHEITPQALCSLLGTHCRVRVSLGSTRSGKPYVEVLEVHTLP